VQAHAQVQTALAGTEAPPLSSQQHPMDLEPLKTVPYQRARFATQLPVDFLYSTAHHWLLRQPEGLWRVGLTKFGTRMLGEVVDQAFQVEPGATVAPGQIVGWIEGFKTVLDLPSVLTGTFAGGNPALLSRVELVNEDPHGAGWLYQVDGAPDAQCVDVAGYRAILDRTIDRLLAQSG